MKFIYCQFKILLVNALLSLSLSLKAEELKNLENEHEFNFFSGMFDFSDDGKKSTIFGLQHQNENLLRSSFLGTLSPVTGALITGDNTPSFTPGLYNKGGGKDLGHIVQFKSEVQVSLDLFKNSQLGMSYNHISNASLGDKNPGANSYMFNFLQKF